jgi:catechol 2,3-dioxygenase-like lactoylglutathione lyase family enzyme
MVYKPKKKVMKLHKLSPILWTKNLQETISFYETVLGFTSRSNFPNFATLFRDDAEIMMIVPTEDMVKIQMIRRHFSPNRR